jgi:hypothetical protein
MIALTTIHPAGLRKLASLAGLGWKIPARWNLPATSGSLRCVLNRSTKLRALLASALPGGRWSLLDCLIQHPCVSV